MTSEQKRSAARNVAKRFREEVGRFRKETLPCPVEAQKLLTGIGAGVRQGLFTLEEVGTSQAELSRFSRLLITH